MAFLTLEEFKTLYGLDINQATDDMAVAMVLQETQDFIQAYTGRNLSGEPQTVTGTYDYSSIIALDDMDIVSISSFTVDGINLTDGDGYTYDLAEGIVYSKHPGRLANITYQFGTTSTPADVKTSFRILAHQAFQRILSERRDPKIAAERAGGASTNYFAIGAENDQGKKALAILDLHKRLV